MGGGHQNQSISALLACIPFQTSEVPLRVLLKVWEPLIANILRTSCLCVIVRLRFLFGAQHEPNHAAQ